MKKSLVLLAAATMAMPLAAVVGTASPAAAASNCGAYPPGHNFGIRNSPDLRKTDPKTGKTVIVPTVVPKNHPVQLSGRLFRNGKPCPHERVYFYFHGPTDFKTINGKRTSTYHYSQSPAYTDNYGLVKITVNVVNDFRWFVNYNVPVTYPVGAESTTQGARTDGQSLVQYQR